jgi:hypothetical protein
VPAKPIRFRYSSRLNAVSAMSFSFPDHGAHSMPGSARLP